MNQGSLKATAVLITLLSSLLLAETATVSRIAFMKDNEIRTKCTAAKHETGSKPIVVMRLSKTPLQSSQIVTEDEDYANINEEGNVDPTAQGQQGYTLVELSKSQVQQLLNSGKLKLMERGDMNEAQVGLQFYNANADDLLVEDGNDFDDDDSELNAENGYLYEEDGRSRRRPWRKVQRIIRRQLIRRPQRYFMKIVRGVVG